MINSIIKFSINNKVLIFIMVIGLIIGGLYSMTKIPLDAVPDITNNQVLVITTAPNLGTEDIEQFVTYQVELAVANLPGVIEIRSISRFGLSVVTIIFEDDQGTFLPRQLVSEALIEIKQKIPKGFGEPFMAPISTGLGEIYQYTLEVEAGYDSLYNDMELRSIQEWIVKRQMAMLHGVVEVNSFGGRSKQYEVAVNPDKLSSMGLTIQQIFDALEKNNQNIGGAYIEKNFQANFIRGDGLMRSVEDIKNTFVAKIGGQAIFIRDIAKVQFGSFLRFGAFTKDGKGEAVGGIVMMLKGENSNNVIKAVKERVELIQKSLPEGVKIKPFLDRSKLIKSTTSTVAENLSLGALIVIFVLVIFMGNLRGGLLVASTIPLALLFAFIMMHIFGVWANLMSLGAIDFGILIDGAVIIVESVVFYLHKKNYIGTKIEASERDKMAYNSASKMMNSAFFGQLIILIVFVPVLVLQGIEGKMFKPMALTFGFALIGVMILCLTYIPMMAALVLQAPKNDKKTFGEKVIIKLENIYEKTLSVVLKRSNIVLILAVVLLILGGIVFSRQGSEFMPQLDEGDIALQAFLKPGTSLSEVIKASTRIEKLLLDNFPDEIEGVQSRIGVADLPMDPMPMDIADMFVIVKPESEWKKVDSKQELIHKIRDKLSSLPGINYEISQPIEMRFNELLTGIRQDLAIKLYGDDIKILAEKAEEIAKLITGIRGISVVTTEAVKGLPQITINYDRNKLGRYGLNIVDLNNIIETAFSGGVAGRIYEGEKMFDLVVRLDKAHRTSIEDIRNLFIALPDGNQVTFSEVAEVSYKSGPMQISRDNTNRRTYVGINVEDRDIKSLVEEIQLKLDEKLVLPSGYYIRFGGAFENMERASERLMIVVPLALAVIFMLVFFAVKSIKQTFMVYISVPFATIGGVFLLYFRDMPLSISAGVGFIVLFGVAVLNGLVLISGFNELKKQGGFTIDEIIKKGSIRRIRPILLTASTDILGFLPMAVSTSSGAEVQVPLATVVIGGMITSTFLTLIVLPILYKKIESIGTSKKKIKLNPVVLSILLVVALFIVPSSIKAQELSLTLEESVARAKENYPTIKTAKLETDKQKSLKHTAFDFGTTYIYTGKEEIGNGLLGVNNQIGVEQRGIDIFGIASKKALVTANVNLASSSEKLVEQILVRDVGIAWYNAVFAKEEYLEYLTLDSLYEKFEKLAEIKYKIDESSKIEFISASIEAKKITVLIKKVELNYLLSLQKLNQYLLLDTIFDINSASINNVNIQSYNNLDSISTSPELDIYSKNKALAISNVKLQKSAYYPKLDVGFRKQKIDGLAGFSAWEVGISAPLLFFSQKAKVRASKINIEIAEGNLKQKYLEVNTNYRQLSSRFKSLGNLLEYYKKEAIPLSDEQIRISYLSYKLGEMDYIQFVRNIESSINTKIDFIKLKSEYYQLSEKLKFIIGN